ncbi:MAG: DNA recombination/repair protein RecA, partial [Clostridia bacterium]|nr:DNA recombination/repair protein RecA [Clostridia bacterium]
PFKTAEFDILYGKGISKESEIIDIAVNLDIIQKSGSWFYYGEQRLAQGKDNVRILFDENKELAAEIEKLIRDRLQNGTSADEVLGGEEKVTDSGILITEDFDE